MAATRILIDFKSSEVGTLRTVRPQHSSVQTTLAFLSWFQMWTFHFALKAKFSIGFGNGLWSRADPWKEMPEIEQKCWYAWQSISKVGSASISPICKIWTLHYSAYWFWGVHIILYIDAYICKIKYMQNNMQNMQKKYMQRNSAEFICCIFCILQYAKYVEYVK